jgi:hypothetical protein
VVGVGYSRSTFPLRSLVLLALAGSISRRALAVIPGLVSLRAGGELCYATGARSSFQALLGTTVVVFTPAQQALQHAVALSGHLMVLGALVIVFPAVVCGAAAVAFDGVDWSSAAGGCGVVA